MSEIIGSLELEFLINNPEILNQLKQTENSYNETVLNIEANANRAGAAIAKLVAKGGFSDSQAEVDAYNASLKGLGDTGEVAISGVAELIKQVNIQFEQGVISADEFKQELDYIAESSARLTEVMNAQTVAEEEEIGILQNLKTVLAELKAENLTIVDPAVLATSNARIQELEAEIARFSNVGKVGFDEVGNKAAVMSAELEKPVGTLNRLTYAAELYRDMAASATNPEIITKYNAKLQETQVQISQLKNVGKQGYDDLGNKIEETVVKQGKFEAALSRVSDLGNIGARVVTQFTRQIIGLGVGFLSLEIGAKAIEALIAYIQNLDIFTGRLDQAKQNMIAFNDVIKSTDAAAGPAIGALKQLYDAATDTNNSMKDRIAAAEQLRNSYPAEFQNATDLAIINGKLKGSYDGLTDSIVNLAKAQAATAKIGQLESTVLDAEFQIAKNNAQKAADLAKIKGPVQESILGSGGTAGVGQSVTLSKADQAFSIKAQTDKANLVPTQTIAIANNQIAFLENLAKGVNKQSQNLKDANDLLGVNLEKFDSLIAGVKNKQQLDNIGSALQIKLNQVGLAPGAADKIQADLRKVQELEKQYSPKVNDGKTAAAQDAQSLKNKIALLQQVADAVETVNRKGLSADQQSLTAISDKFEQLRQKIAAFNADPKNANHQIGSDVINGLNGQEAGAIDTQATLNENSYIQQDIDKKKKLYADYAAYREKVGSEIADAEYADLLRSGKDYQTYLDTLSKSVATGDNSGGIQQRRELIQKAQVQELEDQKVQFQKLLEGIKTYETEKAALTAVYNDNLALLQKQGNQTEVDNLTKQYNEDLGKLADANFEKLTAVKLLSKGVTDVSTQQAQDLINQVTAALAKGYNLTADEVKKIKDLLATTQLALNNRVPDQILAIGSAVNAIGKDFAPINSNISSLLTGLGSVLNTVGTIDKAYNQLQSDIESGKDTTTDYINIVANGIQGLTSLIGGLISASAARKQAEEDYYNSVIAFQNQYNVALDEQVRLQYQTDGNIFLTNYAQELSDAAKAYKAASAQYQQSLTDLQKGQAIVSQKDVINAKNVASSAGSGAAAGAAVGAVLGGGVLSVPAAAAGAIIGGVAGAIAGLFGGKSKANVLAPLLQQYPDLIQANGKFNESLAKTLIANNQVTASTKVLLQNTINYYDEAQTAIDQINSALSSLSQSLGSNLESALVTAFENGTSAAQAFGDSVSAVISNIVSQFLFEDVFGSKFDDLNKKLQATVLAGGSSADITKDFTDFFKDAGPLVQEFQDGLKSAQQAAAGQGINLFQPTGGASPSSSISGAIKGITEVQANVLEGAIRGMQLAVVASNNFLALGNQTMQSQLIELRSQTLLQMQIAVNTKRTADNTDVLPAMQTSLQSIDKNTADATGAILRGAGITKT